MLRSAVVLACALPAISARSGEGKLRSEVGIFLEGGYASAPALEDGSGVAEWAGTVTADLFYRKPLDLDTYRFSEVDLGFVGTGLMDVGPYGPDPAELSLRASWDEDWFATKLGRPDGAVRRGTWGALAQYYQPMFDRRVRGEGGRASVAAKWATEAKGNCEIASTFVFGEHEQIRNLGGASSAASSASSYRNSTAIGIEQSWLFGDPGHSPKCLRSGLFRRTVMDKFVNLWLGGSYRRASAYSGVPAAALTKLTVGGQAPLARQGRLALELDAAFSNASSNAWEHLPLAAEAAVRWSFDPSIATLCRSFEIRGGVAYERRESNSADFDDDRFRVFVALGVVLGNRDDLDGPIVRGTSRIEPRDTSGESPIAVPQTP